MLSYKEVLVLLALQQVNYYSPQDLLIKRSDPIISVSLGGELFDMELLLGDAHKGQYYASFSATGIWDICGFQTQLCCVPYQFTATSTDGTFYLPETGYYGISAFQERACVNCPPSLPDCFDNWLESSQQPPKTPSYQLNPVCKGIPNFVEFGPGSGPWSAVTMATDNITLGFYAAAIQTPKNDSAQSKVVVPVLYAKTLFDTLYFARKSTFRTTPLSGSVAGEATQGGIASSHDGKTLVAALTSGLILTSNDSGLHWYEQKNAPLGIWSDVSSSGDGSMLVAAMITNFTGNVGALYRSTDSGKSSAT